MCRYYRVQGLVQGVGFRAATQSQARHLALVGWVRNCADGAVELVACGQLEALDQLQVWLWQGPAQAEVSDVHSEPWEEHEFDDFSVRY